MSATPPLPVTSEITLGENWGDEPSLQYVFNFDPDRELKITERVVIPDLTAMFRTLKRAHKKIAGVQRSNIEDDGHRVFHVLTQNDDVSIEADYGAPIEGMHFFKDLIDPTRSYRYERVRTIEGALKTHVPQARAVGRHLKAQGYKIFNGVAANDFSSHIHFINGGVTQGFSAMVRYLVAEHLEVNPHREAVGRGQQGVFLVPVPTYGLFLYSMEEILKNTGVEIRTVRRLDNGAVDQASLHRAIDECAFENKRILGYYDCNPHNPSGHIRDKAETMRVAGLLQAVTDKYNADDQAYFETPEGSQAEFRYVIHSDKPQNGIIIMDDMAYEGLEHITHKKPYSFAQVSKAVAQQTVTLKGVSKVGLPGARIGLMIADHPLIEMFSDKQLIHEFTASSLGVDIIAARYSAGPQQKTFKDHQARLRKLHRYQSGILEAFVDGIENTCRLTEVEKAQLVKDYALHGGINRKDAQKKLQNGLPHFFITRDIECGFFMVLNVEALRGKPVYMTFDKAPMPEMRAIRGGNAMYWAFKSFGVDVVPLTSAGADPQTMEARITLSLDKKDLFTLFDRLQEMHAYFFKNRPDVQLDLFRKKPFKGLTV